MSFKLEKDVDFAWVTADFGSGSESYKIAHYSLSLILQLYKKYGSRKKGKKYAKNIYDLTDANALAMRKEAMCTVLLDWKEGVIQDKDGKNVQCGQKEKEQLNIDSPVRSNWIFAQAMDLNNFIPDQEQVAKNSERPLNIENEASEKKNNSPVAETALK